MGWNRDEMLWCGFGSTARTKPDEDVKKVLFPGDTG
jgi:hypothetical protein